MLRKVRSVEDAGAGKNSELGEALHALPGVFTLGRPQVQPGFAVVNAESGRFQSGLKHAAARAIALLLFGDVRVVGPGEGSPAKTPAPAWNTGEVLPCSSSGARSTTPP